MRPTLNLDFANSKVIDRRITVSRASKARYTGADGVVRIAQENELRIDHDPVTGECKGALIEEARTNLLRYSENFDNAAWNKAATTITPNAAIAPDGTATAGYVEATPNTGYHNVAQNVTGILGAAYTISLYAKAGECTRYRLAGKSSVNWSVIPAGVFDLVSGSVASSTGDKTATIESVGNGWYRLAVYGTCANATAIGLDGGPVPTGLASNSFDGAVYPGGAYIWGAQLEEGSTPSSYIPSNNTFTSRASTAMCTGSDGLLKTAAVNEARYEYNPNNLTLAPKLLLEGASTNLLTYSTLAGAVAGTPGAAPTTWSLGSPSTGSIELSSSTYGSADSAQAITFTTASGERIFHSQTISVIAGTQYSLSVFVEHVSGSNQYVIYPLSGTATVTVSSDSEALNPTTTGRKTVVFTAASSGTINVRIGSGTGNVTAGGSVTLSRPQLEASPYPTSYIPTTTAQVTRAADVSTSAASTRAADLPSMTGKNFSDWYNPLEGTFVVEYDFSIPSAAMVMSISDGTLGNSTYLQASVPAVSNRALLSSLTGGVSQVVSLGPAPAPTAGALNTVAFTVKANNTAMATNGGAVATDTSCVLPSVNRLWIGSGWQGSGQLNGHIARLAYYPKALPELLQALSR